MAGRRTIAGACIGLQDRKKVPMSRAAFAITVPLLIAIILAILGGYLVGLSFQGEGCRFGRTSAAVWSAVGDLLLAHAVFGGLLALLVALFVKVLTQRFQTLGVSSGLVQWIVIFAVVAYGAATIMLVIDQGLCSRSGPLAMTATVFGGVAALSVIAAVAAAVVAFVQGSSAGPDKPA